MNLRMNEPVTVSLRYDHKRNKTLPEFIEWSGRQRPITEIGYHHTKAQGNTLLHIFSVLSYSTYFKLVFNTENLQWHIEEMALGN